MCLMPNISVFDVQDGQPERRPERQTQMTSLLVTQMDHLLQTIIYTEKLHIPVQSSSIFP